ncbi:MAG: cobalamin-binding protein [Candidatus Bathyarchaeia archaeon]
MLYVKKFASTLFLIIILTIAITIPNHSIQVNAEGNQSFPLWIVDDYGRNVTISSEPEKIVSLAPSNTEILFALGLGNNVVGVTSYCDYPPEVIEKVNNQEIAIIGGYIDPDVEKIIALDPDLVVADGENVQGSVVETLEGYGFTVIGLDPKNVSQIIQDIILVGEATGKKLEAENLADELNQRIDEVVNKVEGIEHKPRVYYELWYDPLASIGPGTWIHELIGIAGGENIFSDAPTPYPLISPEAVIQRDPEIIVIPLGYMGGAAKSEIKARPGWNSIEAVKNDRIHEIDESLVYRPGPRIVDGLEELAKIIHPELFIEIKPIRLEIETDPALPNVLFSIDGETYATDSSGRIAITLERGNHTIQLISTTVKKGSSSYAFAGWGGLGKTNPLTLSLTSDRTLVAVFSSCLIITATYGSELSQKIDSLREFRDNSVMTTFAGNSFMNFFNEFYYSFSPQVAELLTVHESIRAPMRLILYPLLSILEIAESLYGASSWLDKEFAIIVSGVATSGLIGAVYCSPLLMMIDKLKSGMSKKLKLKPIIWAWMFALLTMLIGEIVNSSSIVGFGASVLVILTMIVSAILTSSFILKLVGSRNGD